jgi:nicotinamide mononucleotide transporter
MEEGISKVFSQYKDVLTHLPEYSKNIFRKDYFKWLFGQMRSWNKTAWAILAFNFAVQVILMWQGWSTVPVSHSIIGFISANLSVLCVVGIGQKAPIQGWAGATSAVFIAINAFMAHNYADMTLQICYFIFLDSFCILSPSWNEDVEVHSIGKFTNWIKYIVFFFVAWGIAYWVYGLVNDPRLFTDSLVLAASLTGSMLEFNLAKEQFYMWLFTSVVTIALWWQTAQMGDANYALFASYLVFFFNDFYSMFRNDGWFRAKKTLSGFGDNQKVVKDKTK